jgi:hypothetical protein
MHNGGPIDAKYYSRSVLITPPVAHRGSIAYVIFLILLARSPRSSQPDFTTVSQKYMVNFVMGYIGGITI